MLDNLPNPSKFPFNWGHVWTAVWVLFLSGWGGVVQFWRKRRDGRARPFNITELIGEVFTSGFAGVLTYLMCAATGVDALLTAAAVGVSGHMGSRAIFAIEEYLSRKFPIYGADQDKK